MLKDSGIIFTSVGTVVMEAAALNDAIAWILLVVAISISHIADTAVVGWIFLCAVAFVVAMVCIVRPLLRWCVVTFEANFTDACSDNNLYSMVFMSTMFSGWFVSQLGLDPIIGSFLLGAVVPRGTRLHRSCLGKMEDIFATMFLPLYFAYSGLKTDLSALRLYPDLPILLMIVVLSSLSKFIGAGLPAYCFGFSPRESSVIALMMNARGLVEFIVLNVGLDAGILNERTFAVMIVMCLLNTMAAFPLAQLLYPTHLRAAADSKEEELVKNRAETRLVHQEGDSGGKDSVA